MASDTPSILIVDDSADKLVALESILLDLRVDIVKARSGKEALRRLLAQDFAVVLLDVRMPVLDGFETATLIRERSRTEHTPIIFITAFGDETHVARGYSLKAVDYILTPVVPEVLRTKVSVFVELFRATAEMKRHADSLRQRAAQLHRLASSSLAINSALSLDQMLAVLTESAREILGAEGARAVAHVDERRTHRAVSAASVIPDVDDGDPPASSVVSGTNRAYRTNRSLRPLRTGPGEDGNGDGRLRTYDVLGAPLTGRDGRNMGLVEVFGDANCGFTQEDEDLLVQLAQMTSIAIENTLFGEAREANRLKEEFLSTLSHELRTPLSAMISWLWMLRRKALDPEAAARAIEAVDRNARAQARLVDDLLDVSRIVTGKLQLDCRSLELGPVVEAATDSLTAAAEAKAITLARLIDPAAGRVLGDADRLQQVIWNLLSNAIKFTPRGGRVEVHLHRAGSSVEARVSDTGQGIAPGFLPHVFERFRQADPSSTRTSGGLGLGLAIVRQLVELHGGSVEALSAGEGRGATFVVSLPLAARPEEPLPAFAEAVPAEDAPRAEPQCLLDGIRVLVVEDEVDARDALSVIMSQAGATVTAVGTARDALSKLTAWRPDVLVCDIGLPAEDGYALIGKVRALGVDRGGSVPAVALTAYAQASDRARALAAGFQAHVAKPCEPDQLLRVLARSVRRLREADPRTLGANAAGESPDPF
ncbi:MAG: response regulator [Deltaproteobacteria bacterium]|nr:MAG: response regulator [Deltaproteobacteria bacterium]